MNKAIKFLGSVFSAFSNKHQFTSAVIVCGGSGTRMMSDNKTTKQHLDIGGVPVIVRTLLIFDTCSCIDEIILVAKKDEIDIYREYAKQYGFTKLKRIVAGGDTRTASVLNGFKAISDQSRYVAIHDGVRCLITEENINEVVARAYDFGAACAVRLCTDTVKAMDASGNITSTIDRDTCRLATTPQVFKTEMYRAAIYTAKKNGYTATDDSALVERLGFKVFAVDCGHENIKITTPTDLLVAEAILKQRKESQRKESI